MLRVMHLGERVIKLQCDSVDFKFRDDRCPGRPVHVTIMDMSLHDRAGQADLDDIQVGDVKTLDRTCLRLKSLCDAVCRQASPVPQKMSIVSQNGPAFFDLTF